ncbi:MAG: hypothetical protein ACREQZ_08035, partial [Woeseiaceae bacterium]
RILLLMQTEPPRNTNRWTLIRDVAVFQVKLLFDGLRDVLFVPVSLVAGLIALIGRGPSSGTEFYDLLRLGRRSERWINLFGAASRVHGPPGDDERLPGEDIDEFVSRIESFVVDEYRRGGVTAQAKANVERALEAIRRRAAPRREP